MLQPINKNDYQALSSYLKSRSQEISSDILVTVSNILKDVREQGDVACKKYTKQFDGIEMDTWKVSEEELDEAISHCDPFFMESMEKAKKNIEYFHQAQVALLQEF